MELIRLILLLLTAASSLHCMPSRTLNDRSTELAWQAWLLVDDQNQHRHNGDGSPDGLLRRRITPKSVFIAPTFSPETLPACADGYRPDSMGRCIKIIKLDEAAHLDFLLQKLNEKFGALEIDEEDEEETEEEEEMTTKGPFQLNIPLGEMESNFEEDIAIIVAPTSTGAAASSSDKGDKVKRTQVQEMQDTNNLLMNLFASKLHQQREGDPSSTTTEAATTVDLPTTLLSTTLTTTEEVPVTSWGPSSMETLPPPTTTTTAPETETTPATVTVPETTSSSATTTQETPTSTPPLTSPQPTETTTTTTIDFSLLPQLQYHHQQQQNQQQETTTSVEDGLHALFYLEPKNSTAPEQQQLQLQQQSQNVQYVAETNTNNNNHHQHQQQDSVPASVVRFPEDNEQLGKEYVRFPLSPSSQYNHRNRDKHMTLWGSVPGAHHPHGKRVGQSLVFGDDPSGRGQAIYRQLESDEFSYLFGNPRNRRNR